MKVIQTYDLSDELVSLLLSTRTAWKVKEDGITMYATYFGKEFCVEVSTDPERCLYTPSVDYAGRCNFLTPTNDIDMVGALFMAFIDGYECCYDLMKD